MTAQRDRNGHSATAPVTLDEGRPRRSWRSSTIVAVLAMLTLLLAACGGDPGQTSAGETGTIPPDESTATQPSTDAAFPVTIEHKYGSTEVSEAPERVVSVGLVEQDALLALGIVPVATRTWFGEHPGNIFPWALDELGDAPLPEVLDFELDFEEIAALRPDLIVGLYSGLSDEEYDLLSQIAPTVAQPGEYVDYGVPWQELTLTVGSAIGREERAEELVADVEERFAEARAKHPEFEGTTIALGSRGDAGQYYALASADGRARFMTSLGLEIPGVIDEVAGDLFYAEFSGERLSLLDHDLLVWFTGFDPELPADLNGNGIYQQLEVVREQRVVFLDGGEATNAYEFGTVLSLPFAIERLVPQLAAAFDRDPATEPTPASS